jgi:hypothetical protein
MVKLFPSGLLPISLGCGKMYPLLILASSIQRRRYVRRQNAGNEETQEKTFLCEFVAK